MSPLAWLTGMHAAICVAGWAHATHVGSRPGALLASGQLAGLLLASLALAQLLIMSRAPWLEQRHGLDGLARMHHRLGQVFLVPLVAHPLLIVAAYGQGDTQSLGADLATIVQMDGAIGASIAFGLFVCVLVYSLIQPWTSWNYQWWYVIHLAMYAAIVLAYWHQVRLGGSLRESVVFRMYWWLVACLAVLTVAVYRVGLPLLRSWRHRFVVAAVVPETSNVTSVVLGGRNLEAYRFRSGQFVKVRFLCPRLWRESHPYSLSLPYDGKQLRLSVKAVGDFSSLVPSVPPGTRVILEGPYGIFTSARTHAPKVLCLAFGIGITPIRAIAEDPIVPFGKVSSVATTAPCAASGTYSTKANRPPRRNEGGMEADHHPSPWSPFHEIALRHAVGGRVFRGADGRCRDEDGPRCQGQLHQGM